MENIEDDKIANEILEGLPPSFMVFGKKKDLDPMEEFWMNKLTNIEKQYDHHVIELQRKLLKDRADRRSIKKQATKICKLKDENVEKTFAISTLKSKTGVLEGELKEKDYETKSLQEKMEKVGTVYKDVLTRMAEERQERMRYEKECRDLRNKLLRLEKEKAQLQLDVDIKESEKERIEEREALLKQERWTFVKNATDLDSERQVQTSANLKLCRDIETLLCAERSLEVDLLRERQIMSGMARDMKTQQKEHQNLLRQLHITNKHKGHVQESLDLAMKKSKDLERNVNHLKEESEFQQLEGVSKNQEIKDLKRRNSRVRCILADTRHKLNICQSEMKSLETEKRRADVELQSAKSQEKALQAEIKRNELRKCKLVERILKTHPFILQKSSNGSKSRTENTAATEIESYKKRIWKLERHKDEVDRKLRDLMRKENIYRLKLDKYAEMEKQIFWTGKAMAKLEGDRQRLERLLKTMESNMPIKVPFKKLVTDPSVLDRLAKNKVLQKRIFQQAEKMEELKSSARRILQFREEQFGTMDRSEEIPIWKLSYWSEKSKMPQTVLSGLDIDIIKQSQKPASRSFTSENYYQSYMQNLNEEIPKLKREIKRLEAKKLHSEVERETQPSEMEKLKTLRTERMKFTSLLLEEEQPATVTELSDEEGESKAEDGQCTPEQSIHGSSYDDTKEGLRKGGQKDSCKAPEPQKQRDIHPENSSTEDERDDESSDAASALPSEKSFE